MCQFIVYAGSVDAHLILCKLIFGRGVSNLQALQTRTVKRSGYCTYKNNMNIDDSTYIAIT